MSVTRVDFRKKRHTTMGKEAIKALCDVIAAIDHEVAGFVVIAWDDTGRSAFNIEEGGPISLAAAGSYVAAKLNSVAPPAVRQNENS